MPEGPPGGLSGADGRTTSVGLPVPGLPGALALGSVGLLHAPSANTQAAASATGTRKRPRITPSYCVVVVALGVLLLGVVELMEPELMEPEPVDPELIEPVAELSVPGAPMEVPLPVVLEPLAVLSVLGVVLMVPLPDVLLPVLLVVSVGGVVVDGVVLDEVEEEVDVSGDVVAVSSRLPQALSERAAIRARAAHCAIGDLIIRNSLRVSFRNASNED